MPTIRVGLNVGATAGLPKESTFVGTISLPYEVHDPVNITAVTFHMKYVRIYTKYTYLAFSCGTTSGWTAVIQDSDGSAVMREAGADLNWPHGNILAQNGREIVFTVKSSNPSWSGNFFGIYSVNEFWIDIDYTITTSAVTPPTALSLSAILSEGSVTLSGSGAVSGAGNAITGYEVQYCDSADGVNFGGWAHYTTVYTGAGNFAVAASPPDNRGYFRQFRARTLGGAGSNYYSAFKEATNRLRRNSAPTAPAYINVSPAILESGNVSLSWPAASDADGNLSHYVVQYATAGGALNWGGWNQLATPGNVSLTWQPALNRGEYIKHRVCAVDAFGVASAFTESAPVLRNNVPLTPAILLPASGANTVSTRPSIKVAVYGEPDGQGQTLQLAVDGGAYTNIAALGANGGTVFHALSLSQGTHTLTVRILDALGAASGTASISVVISPPTFARSIQTGTIIANASVSHRADITELLAFINTARAFYGLAAKTLTGTVGKWADWQGQMTLLQMALGECYAAGGKSVPAFSAVPAYPTAAIINQLRERLLAV